MCAAVRNGHRGLDVGTEQAALVTPRGAVGTAACWSVPDLTDWTSGKEPHSLQGLFPRCRIGVDTFEATIFLNCLIASSTCLKNCCPEAVHPYGKGRRCHD